VPKHFVCDTKTHRKPFSHHRLTEVEPGQIPHMSRQVPELDRKPDSVPNFASKRF
jgi:hypothetical protein